MALLDNLWSYLAQVGSKVSKSYVLGVNPSYLITFIFIIMVKSAFNFSNFSNTEFCTPENQYIEVGQAHLKIEGPYFLIYDAL